MTKAIAVVLLVGMLVAVGLGVAGSWLSDDPPGDAPATEVRYRSSHVGDLCPEVVESSGLAPSAAGRGRLWTLNDGGAPALIEISRRGRCLVRPVPGASVLDWEALAAGPDGYLYIGDIGDNLRRRDEIVVYRVPEDDPAAAAEVLRFVYPDRPHNAESMFVAPDGDLYIITKGGRPRAYRAPAPLAPGDATELERLGRVRIDEVLPAPTGADIDPSGSLIVVVTYLGAYEFPVEDGDVAAALRARPRRIALPLVEQREAVAFSASGDAFYWTSEGTAPPLYLTRRTEEPVR